MRIVILGAGTVGTSIAELLCHHRHSVTVVDNDPSHTKRINDELDVRAVTGSASQSSVLFQADVIGSDICLAVTGEDEVNIVAGSMAKALGARRSVARVYAPVFRDLSTFDYQGHFNIDRLLSLEHLTAMELARGIRHPGSVVLEQFARGELEVQEIVVRPKPAVAGKLLKELKLPKSVRIGSISRGGRMSIARADDSVEPGDRITLFGTRGDVNEFKDLFQKESEPKLTVVIAGGGETGYHLARALEESRISVLLMEASVERCEFLASHLKHTTVLAVDATRRQVLEEERVGKADVFVACTGDDESNIMAGVEARETGAQKIMAVVGRPDYASVLGKLGIDLAVSERQVTARQILGFLNTGAVISRMDLAGGHVSVLEMEILKDVAATEKPLAELPLPGACLIAALMRGEFVQVPGADDQLRPGDMIVMLVEQEVMDEALQLFQVNGLRHA